MEESRTQMRAKQAISEELIDQTLADSFPASDPPSWTLGRDRYAQPKRGVRESAETNKPQESSRETPEPIAVDKLGSNLSRESEIYITEFDMKRLKGLIKLPGSAGIKECYSILMNLTKSSSAQK
jgi:hypothetical protein